MIPRTFAGRPRAARFAPLNEQRALGTAQDARKFAGNGKEEATLHGRKRIEPLRCIFGPNGNVLTIADLPSPKTKRWVRRRKTEVVLAVKGGLLSLDEACRRYDLSVEEFASWESAIEKHRL